MRGSEGVAPASRGFHGKASSSTGQGYTSSGGLAPQLRQNCYSCGVEVAAVNRSAKELNQCGLATLPMLLQYHPC